MRSQRFPARLALSALTLAGLLAAGPSVSAGAPDNRRLAPAECTAMTARFQAGLRKTARRIEQTADRPDARELGSKIVARSLAEPETEGDLSKLLACLAGQGPRSPG